MGRKMAYYQTKDVFPIFLYIYLFSLFVYRNCDSTVPVNSLSLMASKDVHITGHKVIVITTPEREFRYYC